MAAGAASLAAGQQSDHLLLVAAYDAWAAALAKVCKKTWCSAFHMEQTACLLK